MDMLSKKRCIPCEGGHPPMNQEQVQEWMQQIPEWVQHDSKTTISRRFTFKGFQKTISFINALSWIVNQENHHPVLEVGYDYCVVNFTTHAVKGLTENDFICAAKIDKLLNDE